MFKDAQTVGLRDGLDTITHSAPEDKKLSGGGFAQMGLELGERIFDRIEIR